MAEAGPEAIAGLRNKLHATSSTPKVGFMFDFRTLLPRFFLTGQETTQLEARVATFEQNTGCELVFYFSRRLGKMPLTKAKKLFHRLGVHKTKHRVGILMALGVMDRKIAIWADEGVIRRSEDTLWKSTIAKMAEHLKKGERLKALTAALDVCEPVLAKEQIKVEGHEQNELPNKPIH